MKTVSAVASVLLALATFSACGGELTAEKQAILDRDPRNGNVSFSLWASDHQLSYCVDGLSGEASVMDAFRVLLHAADLLKDRTFEAVNLCFRTDVRFVLAGDDFKLIGQEFETQNPMYTLRTFPEKLFLPSGERAYESHEGGVLYLMRVQMADFQDMSGKWFMNDLLAEQKAEMDARRPKEFAPDEEVF